jgi:hypothetical protein
MQDPEPGAAIHRPALTPLSQEADRPDRIPGDPATVLIEHAQPGARVGDSPGTGLVEQPRGAGLILKNLGAGQESHREIVTGLRLARLAGTIEPPGFPVPRMTCQEGEAGHREQGPGFDQEGSVPVLGGSRMRESYGEGAAEVSELLLDARPLPPDR